MVSDPFGLSGGQPLTDMEIEAVAPFAATVRDNARTILLTVFSKEVEVTSTSVNTVPGSEIETTLIGDYFLIEVNLQNPKGELFPCLTFLHRDEFAAGFDLDVPADLSDWSQQIERLQNPAELLVEAVNAHLTSESEGQLTMIQPKVSTISMPDDFASLLVDPQEQWLELKYELDVSEVGQLELISLVSVDLVRRLAAKESGMDAAMMSPEPATVGTAAGADPLLGLGADHFAAPTGRTGADILESIPQLGDSFGGFGAPSAAPAGYATAPAGRGMDAAPVRPAQFPSFGESPSREPASNIDLLLDVNLRVTVELGRTSKSIREVLDLGPGAVIELDKLAGEPVDILVNDKPIAKGEVVVVDENFGVRVTDIVSPQHRVASLR